MNQEKFCKQYLNVSRTTFNRVLHGHANFSENNALRASKYLGTGVAMWLLDDKEGLRMRAWNRYLINYQDKQRGKNHNKKKEYDGA